MLLTTLSPPVALKIVLPSICIALCLILNAGGVWGQAADDHGDTFATATDLPLGSSVAGRIGPGDDRDVFRLDLSRRSGSTDVWVYATGELDTVAWLYDSSENLLAFNDNGFIGSQRSGFSYQVGPAKRCLLRRSAGLS